MAKKLFDVLVAGALLVLLAPPLLLIALLVKATSRGPVIFKQPRLGYRGKSFVIYKFRTMINGSGKPVDEVLKGDRRVTKLGKHLRAAYIDELPQFWNVLKGEMSLVGPRPDLVLKTRLFIIKYPAYKNIFLVRPGMTGESQILGRIWRLNNRDTHLKLDAEYAEKRTFMGDLKILVRTIPIVLKRQGV